MLNVVDFLLKFTSRASLHAPPLLLIGRITLSLLLQMEENEQEEQQEEEEEDGDDEESEEFNVIPPYSEKDSKIESGARGSKRGAAGRAVPTMPLLLPVLILHRELWSY